MSNHPEALSVGPISVLSNAMIQKCSEAGLIRIEPFDQQLLAPTAYRLRPSSVRYATWDAEDGLKQGTYQLTLEKPYVLQPREHVVVAIRERITLSEGFVADFFPASACIEKGLVLVAGRLDANYEYAIVFGVFNASAVEVQLDPNMQLARITFGWLGNDNRPNYSGAKPGAYIDHIADLRKQESGRQPE